jgi:hypothetical protein
MSLSWQAHLLNIRMYSITWTNLQLWVLSCFVVRAMRMATNRNMFESHKIGVGRGIYIYICICCHYDFLINHNTMREHYESYICVLHVCISINYAVLYSCSGDLSDLTYTACGSTGQPALLSHPLHHLGHFKMRTLVGKNHHIVT